MTGKFNGRYDLANGDYILVRWYEVINAYYVVSNNSNAQFLATDRQLKRLLKEQGV